MSPTPVENYNNPIYKSIAINLTEHWKKKNVSNTSISKPSLFEENRNYELQMAEDKCEAICGNPTDIIAPGIKSEDDSFLEHNNGLI